MAIYLIREGNCLKNQNQLKCQKDLEIELSKKIKKSS